MKKASEKRHRGRNEGTIFERSDGRWCAMITLPQTPEHAYQRKSFYGKTRKEVADKLTKALRDRQQGLPVTNERQTLEQFITSWLKNHVRPSVRPKTYEAYEVWTRRHIVPGLGAIPLAQLSPQQVQAFLASKSDTHAPQSIRHMRVVLRRALNAAMKWNLVGRNAASLVDPPRVERDPVATLDAEQAAQFIDAIRGDRLEALYLLSLSLGTRQGEALGIRWRNIRELEGDNPTLTISHTMQRIGGEFRFVEPKTKRSRRTIAIPNAVAKALIAHRRRQAAERLALGSAWQDLDLVFAAEDGSPLERKAVHRDFKRILKKAGLPDIRFHGLRHSAASLLIARAVPLSTIAALLGHSTVSTTADIYAHIAPPLLRDAADRMDSILTAKG